MRSDALSVALAVCLLPAPAPSPAAEDTTTTPEARAEIVEIDVVVRDSKGDLVRDLSQSDFLILEDGKPQVVSHFARAIHKKAQALPEDAVSVMDPLPPGADLPSADSVEASYTPQVTEGRSVLLMVDDL